MATRSEYVQPARPGRNPQDYGLLDRAGSLWVSDGCGTVCHRDQGSAREEAVEQYDLLRSLRSFLQWRVGDSIILAEANVSPKTAMQYFGQNGDRMHMMFNFHVNQNLFCALAASDRAPLVQALKAARHHPETAQWASSCGTTMSWTLGGYRGAATVVFPMRSAPRSRCNCTSAASGDGSRQ